MLLLMYRMEFDLG